MRLESDINISCYDYLFRPQPSCIASYIEMAVHRYDEIILIIKKWLVSSLAQLSVAKQAILNSAELFSEIRNFDLNQNGRSWHVSFLRVWNIILITVRIS